MNIPGSIQVEVGVKSKLTLFTLLITSLVVNNSSMQVDSQLGKNFPINCQSAVSFDSELNGASHFSRSNRFPVVKHKPWPYFLIQYSFSL